MDAPEPSDPSYEQLCAHLRGIPDLDHITCTTIVRALQRQRSLLSECQRAGRDASKLEKRVKQLESLYALQLRREQAVRAGLAWLHHGMVLVCGCACKGIVSLVEVQQKHCMLAFAAGGPGGGAGRGRGCTRRHAGARHSRQRPKTDRCCAAAAPQ